MRKKYELTKQDLGDLNSAAEKCALIAAITNDLPGQLLDGWTPEGVSQNWVEAESAFKAVASEYVTIDPETAEQPVLDELVLSELLTPERMSEDVVRPVTEVIERIRASDGWLPFLARNRLGTGVVALSAGINDLPSCRMIMGLNWIPRPMWDPVHQEALGLVGVENEFEPRIRDKLVHRAQTARNALALPGQARRGQPGTRPGPKGSRGSPAP